MSDNKYFKLQQAELRLGSRSRASAEKFPWGATKKRPKNNKKRSKNSTIMPLPRGATKKRPKNSQKDRK